MNGEVMVVKNVSEIVFVRSFVRRKEDARQKYYSRNDINETWSEIEPCDTDLSLSLSNVIF
jgi:hypothetical protein